MPLRRASPACRPKMAEQAAGGTPTCVLIDLAHQLRLVVHPLHLDKKACNKKHDNHPPAYFSIWRISCDLSFTPARDR